MTISKALSTALIDGTGAIIPANVTVSTNNLIIGSAARVDSSGRLLVGTTGPYGSSAEKLTVNGMVTFVSSANASGNAPLYIYNTDHTASDNQPFLYMHDGGAIRGQIGCNYTDGAMWLNGAFGIRFRNNSGEIARFDSSSNFGIGTGSPGKKVEIGDNNSSTSLTSGLMISNYNGTTNSRAGIVFQSYDNLGCSIWSRRTGSYAGDLCFGTKPESAGSVTESGIIERLRIDSYGYVTKPYQPSFHVNSGAGATSAGNVIVFTNVITNISSSYNNSTGRFTAPIAGTYLFIASYLKDGGNTDTYCSIRKNGSAYANMDCTGSNYTPGSMQAILTLAAGDYVDVYVNGGTVYVSYRQFTGFLIG